MEVLVLTEGSRNIGFGHLTRCLALAQGIEKNISKWEHEKHSQQDNKTNIELIISGDKFARNILKNQKFRVKIKDWVKEYRNLEGKLKRKDLVIIDSYLATKRIYDFIYKKLHTQTSQQTTDSLINPFIHKLICIDDYNRINYPSSIVINGSICGDKIEYPLHSSTYKPIYLLGKNYIILQKEFWRVPRKYIRKSIKDVLITFGGINHSSFIEKLIHLLLIKFPKFNYHLVISNSSLIRNVKHNFNYYSNISALKMRDLMLKCDIAISAGGQTLYELARVGIPTIGICFGENQTRNLEGFRKEGFLKYTGWYSDNKVLKRIDRALKSLISQEVRRKKSVIGKNLFDGKGIERILFNSTKAKYLKDKLEVINLRVTEKHDCRDLWLWRNHPDVRKWAFNVSTGEYKKHKDWFEKKYKDRKVKMYIAENKEGEKVGQVRFEINEKQTAFISINLNPIFFGQGIGNKIIKRATKVFFEEENNVKEIIAEIIAENVTSQKAFRKAGYKFSRNAFKDGKLVVAYEIRKVEK